MTRFGVVLWALACGSGKPADVDGPVSGTRPPTPEPSADARVVALLYPPFEGWYTASNPFDHGVDTSRAPTGPILDYTGALVAGSRDHHAWDFELPTGTPLLAPADGVVVRAGTAPAFHCGLLGREVDDQQAVVLEHVAPDGTVYATQLHHLSSVGVERGDTVRRGQVVGLSGATGCANGPHLHLVVEQVTGDHRVAVDPFGWEGGLPDPWAHAPRGAPSPWLWAEAPPVLFEEEHLPDVKDVRAVRIDAVRYRGWRDDLNPANETVRLVADARFVPPGGQPLDGYALRFPDGTTWPLPQGLRLEPENPLVITVGQGAAPAMARTAPLLPDGGGEVVLLDPQGEVLDRFAFGLAVALQRASPPPSEPFACPDARLGCVPLPLPGAVRDLAWSPSGVLAMVVGTPGLPVVLSPTSVVVVDHVASARGLPMGARRTRWLDDDLLVFDAPRADGTLAVWYTRPGLPAAEAVPAPATGESRQVADARAGALLISSAPRGAPDLVAWRPGRGEPTVVTSDALPEEGAVLSDDGTRVAFLRNGRVVALDLQTGVDETFTGGDPEAVAWLSGAIVALGNGQLVRWVNGQATPFGPTGLQAGALATHGGWVAVVQTSEVVVLNLEGEVLMRLKALARPVADLALRVDGSQLDVAWTATVTDGAPPGLVRHSVSTGR